MTAEEVATQDIKDALRQDSKCFIAFKRDLDPVIEEVTESYVKQQEDLDNKPIFKVGDHLVPKIPRRGYEDAVVASIDDKCYNLRILCGFARIPITAQVNYKLKD